MARIAAVTLMLHAVTQLNELLRPQDVLVGFEASDKWGAIDRMMEHLVETGRVSKAIASDTLDAVLIRERSMSTGMERGIAIPHAAVEGLDEVAACLAILDQDHGLNFESIDHGATHFVVLLLIPRDKKLLHIRTLADVARRLAQESVRSALLEAAEGQKAWQIFCEGC